MNLQQLTVFREVMKTGSVSAAARNLRRTQPAVSASLKALEDKLGLDLFLREGRRLVPVPEAHYLLAEASDILERVSATESNLRELRNRAKGTLKVAAMPGPSVHLLPRFISDFVQETPDVHITLETRSSPQLVKMAAAQSIDVAFCDLLIDDTHRDLITAESLISHCLIAMPASHPLADRESIRAADLDGAPMGALADTHANYTGTKAAFNREGAHFNAVVQAQYHIPLLHFVEAGQVFAVVDVLSAESYRRMSCGEPKLHFARFEPGVPCAYSILTPKQRPQSILAKAFVEAWSAYVRGLIEPADG